jgi:polar amino acid transport system permease protein
MGYDWQWSAITDNFPLLLSGLRLTIFYTITTAVLGLALGSLLAMGRLSHRRWLRVPATVILESLRGVPLLVLLVWFYYALPLLTNSSISAPAASILALSLYGSAYYGEIVRGGILSIEDGQTDAGMSLGMTYTERMRRIILPQAFRRMVPPLVNQSIIQLKNTSLLSVLTVAEMTYQAQSLSSSTYRSLEIYTAVAFLYLLVVIPSSMLSRRLEVKSTRYGVSKKRAIGPPKSKVGANA